MSSLHDELKASLLSAQLGEGGTVELEFCYPESLSAFQGHFPGNPILPGICMFQSLRIGLEKAWGRQLRLQEITNAKFLTPTQPGQTLLYSVKESAGTKHSVTVKAKVTCGDQRVAEFTVNMEVCR